MAAHGARPLGLHGADANGPWPLAIALTLATALHLALLLGLVHTWPAPATRPEEMLEVLILRQATPSSPPTRPQALAQIDRRGTGRAEDLPSDAVATPESDTPPPAPAAPEPAPTAALPSSVPAPASAQGLADLVPASAIPVDAAQILLSRNAEIARLAEQVRERSAAYANRPRRRAVSASTREYKYAAYLEAWRRKVEHIGNLNYPEVAKQRQLYGNLILHVAVRADGQVEGIRVLRSSGYPELDEAAVRIVQLAAPFAPFPPDIRTEADVLDITRTWQFLHGNRLGWGN